MNSEDATIRGVRDVGEWRLVIWLAFSGMRVWLAPVSGQGGVRKLLEQEWSSPREELLSRIESAVYDHPEVLDDFSADILVEENHGLWLPFHAAGEFEGAEAFASVYGGDPADVLRNDLAGEDAPVRLFSLARGLKGFLNRTFPGARISSRQTLLYPLARVGNGVGPRILVAPRNGWCDILAFSGREFLSGSSQQWSQPTDILYAIANLADAYSLDRRETEVSLCLPEWMDRDIVELTRRFFGFVRVPAPPVRDGDDGASFAERLLLSPNPSRQTDFRSIQL